MGLGETVLERTAIRVRQVIIKLVIAVIVTMQLAGCSRSTDSFLRIGTNLWVGYEPLYLARSLDWLSKDTAKLVEYVSATQVMRGLIDGAIDAGALTLDEAILLLQQGVDIKVVLVMDISSGADAVVSRAKIKNLNSLKGRKVGVETTALGAYMMHRAMEIGNLKLRDVTIVPLEHSQHEQAWKDGKIDAVVTFEPVRSRLVSNGGNVILDSSQLPGEIVDVLVVTKKAIKDKKSSIKKLLKTWFKTLDYIRANPVVAAEGMTSRLRLDREGVLNAFDGLKLPGKNENKELLLSKSGGIIKQAEVLSKVMLNNDLLSGDVRSRNLFDTGTLQGLYP